jgi:hypothetical protein
MQQIKVYLVKRKNHGSRSYWLRWKHPDREKTYWEATGLKDKTKAEYLRKRKWNELNGIEPVLEKAPCVAIRSNCDCSY